LKPRPRRLAVGRRGFEICRHRAGENDCRAVDKVRAPNDGRSPSFLLKLFVRFKGRGVLLVIGRRFSIFFFLYILDDGRIRFPASAKNVGIRTLLLFSGESANLQTRRKI
jgi:hypothetical protein